MAGLTSNPNSKRDTGDDNDGSPARGPSTPRWVKAFGIAALIVVALFVIMHLTGHGFGQHVRMSAVEHGAERQ